MDSASQQDSKYYWRERVFPSCMNSALHPSPPQKILYSFFSQHFLIMNSYHFLIMENFIPVSSNPLPSVQQRTSYRKQSSVDPAFWQRHECGSEAKRSSNEASKIGGYTYIFGPVRMAKIQIGLCLIACFPGYEGQSENELLNLLST